MPCLSLTAHGEFPLPYLPACLSPARRAFFLLPPSVYPRGRSPRLPSVTPERFSFSGYLSLPRRTSAITSRGAATSHLGHTRPTSRYHISVPARSDRYVISVQCIPRAARSTPLLYDPSSSPRISPRYYFPMLGRYGIPPRSFLHRNLHLSSLTYLSLPLPLPLTLRARSKFIFHPYSSHLAFRHRVLPSHRIHLSRYLPPPSSPFWPRLVF